jgi:hypothetical protein
MTLDVASGGIGATERNTLASRTNRNDTDRLEKARLQVPVSSSPRGNPWLGRALRILMTAGVAIGLLLGVASATLAPRLRRAWPRPRATNGDSDYPSACFGKRR